MKRVIFRKQNRLSSFDYSSNGYYFVTICTKGRIDCFGDIKEQKMILNPNGEKVKECWLDLPNHYANCLQDEFVVMPNHFHGIIIINNIVGNGLKPFPTNKTHSLSELIRGFKTFSSRKINEKNVDHKFSWQKSFYDHIIRNEKSLQNIREYIINNPLKWDDDPENLNRDNE